MKLEQRNHIEDIKRFLNSTDILAFNVLTTKQERYQWTHKALKKDQYQNLANISVSHLYNSRHSKTYQHQRFSLTNTRPKKVAIGIRGKPCPNDKPGYVRIDSIHQGDQDKLKVIYHINTVDAVTQLQMIVTVGRMSEAFMSSTIQQILELFPFEIPRFHADNGGEYINDTTAALLDKLLIEFTKSRPRHSNNNALVISKNGSVIRKLYSY
jgi:hypothetical protein